MGLIAAAFLPWQADGRVALDAVLGPWWSRLTVGLLLVLIAALPAIAALVSARGWPRLVSAVGAATLVLYWLAAGADGAMTSGIATALGATVGLLLAAALPRTP